MNPLGAGRRAAALSGWSATWLQAGWSARRLLRGRMLWVAAIFALGPVAFTTIVVKSGHHPPWDALLGPLLLLAGIVPPLFTAVAAADEIEDRTYTYLWSRPLPRWSVLLGKLVATAPLAAAILCLTALICHQIAVGGALSPHHPWPANALSHLLAAMALAGLVLSMVAGGMAILMPRHGLGVSYAYLLVLDFPLSAMPFSIANLGVGHHLLVIGGAVPPNQTGSPGSSALWLLGIGLFWLAIGLWRLSRSEFAASEK